MVESLHQQGDLLVRGQGVPRAVHRHHLLCKADDLVHARELRHRRRAAAAAPAALSALHQDHALAAALAPELSLNATP